MRVVFNPATTIRRSPACKIRDMSTKHFASTFVLCEYISYISYMLVSLSFDDYSQCAVTPVSCANLISFVLSRRYLNRSTPLIKWPFANWRYIPKQQPRAVIYVWDLYTFPRRKRDPGTRCGLLLLPPARSAVLTETAGEDAGRLWFNGGIKWNASDSGTKGRTSYI